MKTVNRKIHFKTSPENLFRLLTNPKGQEQFWVERSRKQGDTFYFNFPNGEHYDSKILKMIPNKTFALDYFNSEATFKLDPCDNGGTDLTLINAGVYEDAYAEVYAGWTSVLLNLKAVADFGADLRNHNPHRTWDQGYVDN